MPPQRRYGMDPARMSITRLLARVNDRPESGQGRRERYDSDGRPSGRGTTLPPDVDMVARNRRTDTAIVTQRVSKTPFAGGKNAKGKQAWKYPGGNIIRASTVYLNGRYYTDPKEPDAGDPLKQGQPNIQDDNGTPRRKQESNFFITINPNNVYKDALEDRAKERFHAALNHLAQNEVLVRCLKFGPKDPHYTQDIAFDVVLPGIDWKASVEVGERLGRMHAHIICYIQHYSQIQFEPKMLQYEFRAGFNAGLNQGDRLILTEPPYVQVKMLPQSDWTTIMRQYIRKGMES